MLPFVCLVLLIAQGRPQSFGYSIDNPTINTVTSYSFNIADPNLNFSASISGTISFTFTPGLYAFTLGSYICQDLSSSINSPCSVTASNVLSMPYPGTLTRNSNQNIKVFSLRNPPNTATNTATVSYTFTATNGTIMSSVLNRSIRVYIPAALSGCTAVFNPNSLLTRGQLIIIINTTNPVDNGAGLDITLPATWGYTPDWNTNAYPPISTPTPTFTKLSANSYLQTQPLSVTATSTKIYFQSVMNAMPASNSVSFGINSIMSPPTTSSANTVIVTTYTPDGTSSIDSASCVITTTNLPLSLSTTSTFYLGTITPFLLTFISPTPLLNNDLLILTVNPSSSSFLNIGVLGSYGSLSNSEGYYPTSISASQCNLVLSVSNQPISSPMSITVQNGLSLLGVVTSGTYELDAAFYRTASFAAGSLSITILPNYLINATLVATSTTVMQLTPYTLTLKINNALGIGAEIKLSLPSDVSILSPCASSFTSPNAPNGLSPTSVCTVLNTQTILLSSFNVQILPSASTLVIQINNIRNPTTTKPTQSFRVDTYYSSLLTSSPVDTSANTTLIFTPTHATITNANASSSSPVVYATATHTIAYLVATTFPPSGSLVLTVPPQIKFTTPSATLTLTYPNDTSSTAILATTANATTVTISGISANALPANTIVSVALYPMTNPPSFAPSSSYSLRVYSSDGYLVEQVTASSPTLTISNSQADPFSAVLLRAPAQSNTVNGKSVVYTLQLQSVVSLVVGDVITVQLSTTSSIDTQMSYSSPVSCSILSNGVSQSPVCSLIALYTLTMSLLSPLSSLYDYQLTITSIKLARTFMNPSDIIISTFSNNYPVSKATYSTLSNQQTNSLVAVQMNISTVPSQLNQIQTFTVLVQTTNGLSSGDFVVIIVPSSYLLTTTPFTPTVPYTPSSLLSQSLCTSSLYFCSNYQGIPNQIKVEQIIPNTFSNTTSLSVQIKAPFRSPETFAFTGQTFTASTYNIFSSPIDSTYAGITNVSSALFYLTCANHCKTCNADGSCSSCYAVGSGYNPLCTYDGYIYMTSDGKCVTVCGNGYFNLTGTCMACNTLCATCVTSSTTCTSCIPASVYNKYVASASTCASVCPVGYYPDLSNVCQQCSPNCNTCATTYQTCLSCISPLYLLGSTCVAASVCQSNGLFASATNTCASCDISCLTCVSTATTCTNCALGYILQTSLNATTFTCTNLCPPGLVNDSSSNPHCHCSSLCLTCQTTINNCISCALGKLLYANTCAVNCPPSTYIFGGNCVSCADLHCQTCTSTACSTCNTPYGVYLLSCVLTCPNSFVMGLLGGVQQCLGCSTGCISCTSTTVCSKCSSGYMMESGGGSTLCTTTCSPGTVNFNNTVCLTSCGVGYTSINGVCQVISSNTTTTPTTPTTPVLQSKLIPFPIVICIGVLTVICLASKAALTQTLLSCAMCAVYGILEMSSWLVLLVILLMSQGGLGLYFLGAACLLTVALNILQIYFIRRYVWVDEKIISYSRKLDKKGRCGMCISYAILGITVTVSHKAFEILFSNLFGSGYLKYRVTIITTLTPINIVRYCSLLPSILAIIGASVVNYQMQTEGMSSLLYTESIDCIVASLCGLITAIWTTIRLPQSYEKNAQQTANTMENLETNNFSEEIGEAYQVGKGPDSQIHVISTGNQERPDKPIPRPIIIKNSLLGNSIHADGNSYNGLLPNRIKDQQLSIEQIKIDEECLTPSRKKAIRHSIEQKMSSADLEKTKVIAEVDSIPIEDVNENQRRIRVRMDKLDKIARGTAIVADQDQKKVSEIKGAINILSARNVDIEEYLRFLDIEVIQEEPELEEQEGTGAIPPRKPYGIESGRQNNQSGLTNSKLGKSKRRRERGMNSDQQLFVPHIPSTQVFDEEEQPVPPILSQVSKRKEESQPADAISYSSEEQKLALVRDFSAQRIGRHRARVHDTSDLQIIDLNEGNLGSQFQGGKVLPSHDTDDAPVNIRNSQAAEKESLQLKMAMTSVPIFNRMHMDFNGIESMDFDLGPDVSPSHFNQQNLRLSREETDQIPSKPKRQLSIEDYDEFAPTGGLSHRYGLDYDRVIVHGKADDRMKELEKIYLPRQGERHPPKRVNSKSSRLQK